MPSLRDIRRRIRSVSGTQQITKAMEMVAAAKLRKAQSRVESSRPYALKMQSMLDNLTKASAVVVHPLFEKREVKKVALVVISSDRGLCGSYNSNIIRATDEFLKKYQRERNLLINIGKKGYVHYSKRPWEIRLKYLNFGGNLVLSQVREITNDLVNLYLSGEVDEVYFLYTRFVSAMTHRVTLEKFLNIESKIEKQEQKGYLEYIFEPSAEKIFSNLLPNYCMTKVQMALAESFASEHGSRMISMGAATKNAEDMIEHLTLVRNKLRQASITKEMLEITTSAEALKG
jgi:F-type H+-transporting ATPase subunit gamma